MNASINPPSPLSSQESYQAECLFALEPSIETLVGEAVKAGWKRDAITLAILMIVAGLAGSEGFVSQLS